jgi:hypothetical protein
VTIADRSIDEIAELIEVELETFQWAYPGRTDNRGEIGIDYDTMELVLEVWTRDNDDPSTEVVRPLHVTLPIRRMAPREQIRDIIHQYLCHEADEQMYFGEDRPYYPSHPS